jgi:hypothetical protein
MHLHLHPLVLLLVAAVVIEEGTLQIIHQCDGVFRTIATAGAGVRVGGGVRDRLMKILQTAALITETIKQ